MQTQQAQQNYPKEKNGCLTLPIPHWDQAVSRSIQAQAVEALEQGSVMFLPNLPFSLSAEERGFLREDCVGGSKSVKYALAKDSLWGESEKDKDSPVLKVMLRRYAESARDLITALFPTYAAAMTVGNTSFRPVEAEGRVQSKRHDDRLLHVDAFPSRPMYGKRLLRVFTNVNPGGQTRLWRTGEPFVQVAERFLPRIPKPLPGSAALLHLLKITKEKRSPYDHYMLHIHDKMKLDDTYQATVSHTDIPFPAGSSWVVYSDQVSHAALSGQYMMEQTFLLPVAAMANPATSPLRVLESLMNEKLI